IIRTQSSFSERFFSVFILGYFLFHHSPLWVSKYHFENFTRIVLVNGFLRGKL
ncbi:putative nef attachable protein, partial [Chlamydia psittaci 02DC18]